MSADEQVQYTLDKDKIIEKKVELDRKRQALLKRMEILANNLKTLDVEDKHWDAELAYLENANVPILCLSNEITSLIFELARGQSKFDDDDPALGYWTLSTWRPEMKVSRVCRDWRQVAISCPTIWSHIVINNWIAGGTHRSTQRLSTHLTRSQDMPLDIVVTIKAYMDESINCTDALREFLLVVTPHAARWQRLVIWVDGKWDISPFSSLAHIAVPQLEVFEIGSWPYWRRSYENTRSLAEMSDFVTLFQAGALKLTSALTCSQLLLPSHSRTISTVYIQSNEKLRPWKQFLALISLPKLRHLTLDGPIFKAPELPITSIRVVVRNLRYFRLGCPVVSRYMWDTISAPKLALLMLFEMSKLKIDSMASTFPQGFFPSLKTLAFWDVDTGRPDDLLHLAMATSHVTDLVICDCGDESVFMLSLYKYSFQKNTQLWPQLHKLTYVVKQEELCFSNRAPKTYQEARGIILQLVDWRLEVFARRCTLLIEMAHRYEEGGEKFLPYDIPLYDDCCEEEKLWNGLFLPWDYGRLIPWPENKIIGAGYYGKRKFDNDRLMCPDHE